MRLVLGMSILVPGWTLNTDASDMCGRCLTSLERRDGLFGGGRLGTSGTGSLLDASYSRRRWSWNLAGSIRPVCAPTQLSTVRYRGTLDVEVAILKRDSLGVFGAFEFVQLNREAFGGDEYNSWSRRYVGID